MMIAYVVGAVCLLLFILDRTFDWMWSVELVLCALLAVGLDLRYHVTLVAWPAQVWAGTFLYTLQAGFLELVRRSAQRRK